MVELLRDEIAKRHSEFPELIRKISYNNSIVYQAIEMYAHGTIVSKEEAYCQMVKGLSITYDELIDRMTKEAHMKMAMFIPPDNLK
jgi:hypothetical protein